MKKIFSLLMILSTVFALVACSTEVYTVTFDSQGGSAVAAVEVEEGQTVSQPANPTLENHQFSYWSLAVAGQAYDFSNPVESDLTLYAVFTEDGKNIVAFDSRGGTPVPSAQVYSGQSLTSLPTPPTREGYRFVGWYETTIGGSWRDPEQAPLTTMPITANQTVYAAWEPLNSRAVNYLPGETYKAALSGDVATTSPLYWSNSLEGDVLDMLSTPFYSTEVDWAKAIEEGLADYEGDFSKFRSESNPTSTILASALDFSYRLVMAASYPVDAEGNDYTLPDGSFDKELAGQVKSSKWTFTMRDDVKFENGLPITADTVEYSLKAYIDPNLAADRADSVISSQYLNLKGADAYFNQTEENPVTWDTVGFEKVDTFKFTLEYATEMSLKQAVDMMDIIYLIPFTAFEQGYNDDATSNNYGTSENPLLSYGEYVVKEWSPNQRWIFNKNFDYIGKDEIMYKSISYEVVANEDQREQLFSFGLLNSFGLSANYYAKYINDPSLLEQPGPYATRLSFNNNARTDGEEVPSIVADPDFRFAFFYGINREDFAATAAAPDSPTLGFLSDIHISAIENLVPYQTTQYHFDNINDPELGLSPETVGYLPNKAVELFNAAYDRWVAEGNSGPVVLDFLTRSESTYWTLTSQYIEKELEELFNTPGQTDKLDIQLNFVSNAVFSPESSAHNYDITFNTWGGATSYALFFMYAIFGNIESLPYGREPGFDLQNTELEMDFSAYASMLRAKDPADLAEYEDLFLNGGTVSGTTIIPVDENGIWRGTILEFADFSGYAIEDASDYEMKHDVIYTAIQAIERELYLKMTVIPLVATASSTVYNDLFIEWPEYTLLFGWGSSKYRFLTSDPDFAFLSE